MGQPFHGLCILGGGDEYAIHIDGEVYRFEFHDRFGPLPLTKTGRERSLGPKHKFWTVVTWWSQQGRRVDENGVCIWEQPKSEFEGLVHLGGRNWGSPEMARSLGIKEPFRVFSEPEGKGRK